MGKENLQMKRRMKLVTNKERKQNKETDLSNYANEGTNNQLRRVGGRSVKQLGIQRRAKPKELQKKQRYGKCEKRRDRKGGGTKMTGQRM